ncbi:hypothetical protein HPB50_014913 [Hyalomma asiaticum]|uniref:Uncharacterized protein n=1 Tax=Hyalomma asiaticum TaxID=266040 RepID=A0ACB7SQ78_HYAAI|nr:hypothetical protein HPB50_014913 [Hyalomma asiaticum]
MIEKQLLELVASVKSRFLSYIIDNTAVRAGCILLRLPPYHCEFNPIELVWAKVKNGIAADNRDFKLSVVDAILREKIKQSDDKDCVLDCPSRTNCVAQTCCGPRGKEGVNTPDVPAPADGTVLRTNDVVRVPARKAFQNYCELINEISKLRPEIRRIYASLILPRTTNRRQRYSNAAFIRCFNEEAWYFNELVKKFCAHSRLVYFLDHGFEWLPSHRVLAADGVHPNFEGVSLMACHIRCLCYKTFSGTSRVWSDCAPSSPFQQRTREPPEINKPSMSTPPIGQTVNCSPSESASPPLQRKTQRSYTNNASKNRPECSATLAAPLDCSPSALCTTDASPKVRRYELRSTYAQAVQAAPAK